MRVAGDLGSPCALRPTHQWSRILIEQTALTPSDLTFERPSRSRRDAFAMWLEDWKNDPYDPYRWIFIRAWRDFDWYVDLCDRMRSDGCPPQLQVPLEVQWAFVRDDLVGELYLCYEPMDGDNHIGYKVRPSHRRRRVGTALLRFGLERLKELGIQDARLTCADTNVASAALLESAGKRLDYELVARYQMPTWLGLSMLVMLFVVPGLRSATTRRRVSSALALGAVLVAGATSVFVDRPFTEWWDNNDHFSERAVADVVSAGPHPALVIASDSADNAYDTFVLSRYLAPKTPMLLFGDKLPALPQGYAATYFFTPTRNEIAEAFASTGVAPQNVSPSAGFKVPELNAARAASADTVVADNALWKSLPKKP